MKVSNKAFYLSLFVVIPLLVIMNVLLYLAITGNSEKTVEHPVTPEDKQEYINSLDNFETEFLTEEEVVIVTSATNTDETIVLPVEKVLFEYVEVIDGCGPYFGGECLNVRSGPGTEFPAVKQLRNGVVLKIDGKVENEDLTWYKIVFDEWLRYQDRVDTDWYVASDYVEVLFDEGARNLWDEKAPTTTKEIYIDRSDQMLYAYEGDELFMEQSISTGLVFSPTPRGTFTIFRKTPSRYMQGPIPGITNDYYDMPGVPWNLYFTEQGAVIHGAYWHDQFGKPYSHGCVNVSTDQAKVLYNWADIGMKVVVRD